MEGTFQVFFSILSWTSVMVLVVLGLGVIASMMGIFNFAHGDFMLLGGYTLIYFLCGASHFGSELLPRPS